MKERTTLAFTDFPESQEEFFREIEEIDALLQIEQERWLEP